MGWQEEEEVPDDEPSVEHPEDEEDPRLLYCSAETRRMIALHRKNQEDFNNFDWESLTEEDKPILAAMAHRMTASRAAIEVSKLLVTDELHMSHDKALAGDVAFPVCDFCSTHGKEAPDGYRWIEATPDPSKIQYLDGACH